MTEGTPRISRGTRWLAAAALIAAALAGALVGAAADRFFVMRSASWTRGMPPRGEPTPAMRRHFLDRMTRDLDLNEVQRRQVEALIERGGERMRATGDSVEALVERRMTDMRAEFAQILTAQQMQKFRAMAPPPR